MTSVTPVVHVVDDEAPFRRAVARLLRASGYQAELYDSGEQFLECRPVTEPGCILLDLRMAGIGGLEVQARLSKQGSILPIIFLTAHGDIPGSVRAIKAGAEDFLSKPISKAALLTALDRALIRYEERRQRRDRLDNLRALVATLTPRESAVFALVIRGKLNKQIAHELGASVRTIKAHRHVAMEKLKVRSLAEAVLIGEQLGVVSTHVGNET